MPSGPWSPSDVAHAVSMRADGATADAIAAALGRSAAAVSLRLHRARAEGHAVPVDRTLTRWTPERTERAVAMWCSGVHVDDIAVALGTTPKAARACVQRMRGSCPWIERPPSALTLAARDRDARLARDWQAGASVATLAETYGHSPAYVRRIASRLRRRGDPLDDRRKRPVARDAPTARRPCAQTYTSPREVVSKSVGTDFPDQINGRRPEHSSGQITCCGVAVAT